jgi:hypothetical protein
MTTNVFDRLARQAATDSRWSATIPGYAIVYLDDGPFDKILLTQPITTLFAGCIQRIDAWKTWLRDPNRLMANIPVADAGIAICMIDMRSSSVVFEHNQEITLPDARFAGTGAWPAHGCWGKNKDARRSVESAKLADRLSGGSVKYVDFASGATNLPDSEDYASIKQNFSTKGMVMYFQNPGHVALPEAVANDPVIAQAADQIAKGEIKLTAPSPAAMNEWTAEDVARLHNVLAEYFPAS